MAHRNVLIAGAGIAGPALAHWLDRHGMRATIVERAPALRDGGQTVDVRGAGREVVRRMGLEPVLRAHATREEGIRFVDGADRVKAAFPSGAFGGQGPISDLEILRADLSRVLYEDTVPRTEYLFGDEITHLAEVGEQVHVTFRSGTERAFDLVVAADGARSRTRDLVFGPPEGTAGSGGAAGRTGTGNAAGTSGMGSAAGTSGMGRAGGPDGMGRAGGPDGTYGTYGTDNAGDTSSMSNTGATGNAGATGNTGGMGNAGRTSGTGNAGATGNTGGMGNAGRTSGTGNAATAGGTRRAGTTAASGGSVGPNGPDGPDRAAALGRSPDGLSPDGRSPDGRSPDGRSPDGRSSDGRSSDGRSSDGRSSDGRSAASRLTDVRSVGISTAYLTIPHHPSDGRWARWHNAPGGRTATLRPDNRGTTRASLAWLSPPRGHERLAPDAQRTLLRALFADVGWEVPRILAALDDAEDFFLDHVVQVRMPTWSRGRVVVVGDAAYCASPLSGMGTSLALTGAYVLAGELAHHARHGDAFARYEHLLRPYTARAQHLPPGVPRVASPRTRVGIRTLNTVLRAAAHPRVAAALDRFLVPPADTFTLPPYGTPRTARPTHD
ncbi:FAD-dependent monooxygenase [Streptomyces sp. BI20]|uniref:FAD-dependent monooxygenase n=1 Tax=Streptomyces sp. BI20 TaxID=3403460 RepID=UPI003C77E442